MDTQKQIDNLIELAIEQREEIARIVNSLPELRNELRDEVALALEELDPYLRNELSVLAGAEAKVLQEKLSAEIKDVLVRLEFTAAAKYNALIKEREQNAQLLEIAEQRIQLAAAELPEKITQLLDEAVKARTEFAVPNTLQPLGKWTAGEYQALDVVSLNGDSYIANETTREKPSRSAKSWTLLAARGAGGGGSNINSITDLTGTPGVGQLLIGDGGTFQLNTLTAGSNVTITNTPGGIEIAATGGGGGSGTVTKVAATGDGAIAVSGSPITTSGTFALSLASTAVTAGSYGAANKVGTFTVDSQGRLTAAADATISISTGQVTGLGSAALQSTTFFAPATIGSDILSGNGSGGFAAVVVGTGLTYTGGTLSATGGGGGGGTVTSVAVTSDGDVTSSGGPITASGTFTLGLSSTSVTAGSYGAAGSVGTFTVDAKGRLTAAANTAIAITAGQVSGLGTAAFQNTTYFAPATTGTLILAGNGSGGFSTVTVGSGLTYNAGTLASTAGGGSVTSVALSAGTGISISGGPITTAGTIEVTNTAPDQVIALTQGGTTTITGTYPNFTISSADQYTGTVTSVSLTAGTGISISGGPITSSGSIQVTNSAPDQVVALTQGGTTTITGTYPNFTISSADQYTGTVTSVTAQGSADISVTGGPITSSGTLHFALSDTTVAAGNYGTAGSVPSVTVDAKGRLTAAANVPIAITAGQVSGLGSAAFESTTYFAPATTGTKILSGNGSGGFSDVTVGTGLTYVGGTLSSLDVGGTVTSVAVSSTDLTVSGSPITSSGTFTLDLASTAVTAGSYGNSTNVAQFSVDAKGRLTAAANVPISITSGQVSDGVVKSIFGQQGVITALSYAALDTTASITPSTGQVSWDSTEGAIKSGLIGSSVQALLGVDSHIRVYNPTGQNMVKGQAVVASGSSGTRLSVTFGLGTTDGNTAETLGLVAESITNNQQGYILTKGLLKAVNTNAYNEGDILYISSVTPGALTNVRPIAPNHAVRIGYVIKKAGPADGIIYVDPLNGFELGELHDTYTSSVTNNDFLVYDGTDGRWENYTAANARTAMGLGSAALQATTYFAPATTSTAILAGNGSGGFSPVTVGTGLSYVGGTLSALDAGGTVTSVTAQGSADISVTGGPITTSGTLYFALSNTTVAAGTYGSATQVGQFNVDAKGRLTSASSVTIQIGTGQVTGLGSAATQSTTFFAPATTSTAILAGNGSGGFSSVTVGSGLTYASGTLSNTQSSGISYIYATSNITATDKQGILTDTTGGTFTVTLPATPSTGAQVIVADAGANWGTTNLTIGRNGSTIGGLAENLVCDITGASVTLIYDGTTWEYYAQIGGNGGNAVTLNGIQTLTNKTISGSNNTITNVSLTASVTGTLPVANGGSGATTLTGVLKGNGTSAFTAATAGTDYVAPATSTTFTAQQVFSGSSSVLAAVFNDAAEIVTVSATAATGTINYDVTTQSVLYYTTNASGNFTVNIRASSGTSLNTALAIGQSSTVVFLVTNGTTAYYNTSVQVDGTTSGVTTRWQGGTAPTSGNASSIDAYSYTVIKTANATFTVLASQTRFA